MEAHTIGAERAARLIMNNEKYIQTLYGKKTLEGIADLIDKETDSPSLIEQLKRATYFVDQIRLGNAYSEEVLWKEVSAYRSVINRTEGG